jgi:hypothetical protein
MLVYSLIRNDEAYYYATMGEFGSIKSLNWVNLFEFTIKNNIFLGRSVFQNAGSAALYGLYTGQCSFGPQTPCEVWHTAC